MQDVPLYVWFVLFFGWFYGITMRVRYGALLKRYRMLRVDIAFGRAGGRDVV